MSVASSPGTGPGPGPAGAEAEEAPSPRRGWRRPLLTTLLVGTGAVVAVVFRSRVAEWWHALLGARWEWALLAAVVQLVSFQCLVVQQRVLLRAGGGQSPLGALTGTLYAGNAISIGVPVAGAAASAAYTFRRLHTLGNPVALVSWDLAVSGISSTVTLAAVLAVGAGMTGSAIGAVGAFIAAVVAVVPVVVAILVVRHGATRGLLVRVLQRGARTLGRRVQALRGPEVAYRIDDLLTSLGSFRLGVAGTAATGLLSLVNWVLDAACLAWPWCPSAGPCRGRGCCWPGAPARWSPPRG